MTLLITVTLKSGTLLLLPIELILPVLGILLIRTESPIRGLIYRSFLGSIAALIYASVGAPDVALTEVLVGTLLSFNVFDIIWLITKGGPSGATTTLPLLIYETAFTKFRLSQAAALSVITSIILLTFSILFIKFMSEKQDD